MTERLYYTDSYLQEFRAQVVDVAGHGHLVYLDRSAFYPASGGQPFDTGWIAGIPVLEVSEDGDRIAHRTALPGAVGEVDCRIDWPRRFDHMQQHSGQHLLSAVFAELLGIQTVSFHLGAESSTIDLGTASLDPASVQEVERRTNEAIFENRPISVSFEQASESVGLRKLSEREGTLRIISIEGIDRSACGGTHLRSSGEIGAILIRKLDKVRNSVRVEFLCGGRAVRRARADFEALSSIAQMFSAPLGDTPALVAAQLESSRAADKQRRKLKAELAEYQGRELYAATAPDATGMRRVVRRLPSGTLDDLRDVAQSFTAQPKAAFIGIIEQPPSMLLAVSADSGVDAGKALETALAGAAGRGGGNARIAQGSLPKPQSLDTVLKVLL